MMPASVSPEPEVARPTWPSDGCRVISVVAHRSISLCILVPPNEHMTEEQILKIDVEGDVAN